MIGENLNQMKVTIKTMTISRQKIFLLTMDIQVHHMSTVKLKVQATDVHSFQKDLRDWKIQHNPFRKYLGFYLVDVEYSPKVNWLILKYGPVNYPLA